MAGKVVASWPYCALASLAGGFCVTFLWFCSDFKPTLRGVVALVSTLAGSSTILAASLSLVFVVLLRNAVMQCAYASRATIKRPDLKSPTCMMQRHRPVVRLASESGGADPESTVGNKSALAYAAPARVWPRRRPGAARVHVSTTKVNNKHYLI